MTSYSGHDGYPGISAQVLTYLKNHNARLVQAREIKESLNTTRQRIYESITYLRECGYQIESNTNEGYRLTKSPDTILPVEIAANLSSHTLGCRIFSYHSIGSTNEAAHGFAKAGLPEGTLVIAERQTKGRGRMGRKWHSPPKKGLYFSLVLRPKLPPFKIPGISLMAGLAVLRAIHATTGTTTLMKWPNDILFEGKKLAGILIELKAELDRVEYLVVGIGINVNHLRKDFSLTLGTKATSLKIISKKDIFRAELLRNFLIQFEKLYENFCRHGLKYMSPELISCSSVLGKRVNLNMGKKRIIGQAVGFDDNGGLIIKNKTGLNSYSSGDVTSR
jgi:BirA family transcriptional regulator, biotin operon repressor / biotin---[acetyl-CoA-carboxylase] ligase